MPFTTPATASAGSILTAAWLNTYVRDNIAWIATDSPACRAYNNANFSHTSSGFVVAVTLNSERFDNATVHDTSSNTDRFTIPSGGGGKYLMGGAILWDSNTTGGRTVSMWLSGVAGTQLTSMSHNTTLGTLDQSVCTVYDLTAGQHVVMGAYQNSGGTRTITQANNYSPEAYVFWFRT